jgi:hypothetical protein
MPQTNLPTYLVRKSVYIRDKYKCRYCGCTTTLKDRNAPTFRTIDHLIPRALGGRSHFINLVTACRRCNEKKSHKSVREAGMTLRPAPKHQDLTMDAWFEMVYLHRCVNCNRASKNAHSAPTFHGGPKYCLANGADTLYMSRNHYEYLKSLEGES